MAEMELERIYTIPLRKPKQSSRNKRANRGIDTIRAYLTQHMKATGVWIDAAVNHAVWDRGMYKIPSKIRVRAVKFDDGVVEVSLPEEEVSKSIRTTLAEERESKAPILAPAEVEEEAPPEAEQEKPEGAEKEASEEETSGEEKPASAEENAEEPEASSSKGTADEPSEEKQE